MARATSLLPRVPSSSIRRRGFSLAEALVAAGLFVAFATATGGLLMRVPKAAMHAANAERAAALAEEGLEAARNLRDAQAAFKALPDGTYGLVTGGVLSLTASPDATGIFSRSLTIATLDERLKQVTATVRWKDELGAAADAVTVSTRLASWRDVINVGNGLTVTKTVINHGGSRVTSDFAPFRVGTTTVALGAATLLADGTYAVTEAPDAAYAASFGGDCDSTGHVTMASNATKTCLITNEERRAYLTVTVSVTNAGGTMTAGDFAVSVDGVAVASGAATMLNSGVHLVAQAADARYVTTIGGDCSSSGDVTLTAGATSHCTVTNVEKPARVIVAKSVVSYTGSKTASDFAPFKVGGNTVALGAETLLNSGTYAVTEAPDAAYAASFGGDCDSTGHVTLVGGQTKTCQITNTEIVSALGDWSSPNTVVGSVNLSGIQRGLKVRVVGRYAYMIRDLNGNSNFVVFDVTNLSSPVAVATLSLTGTPTQLDVAGGLAFVTSTDGNGELKTIDVGVPTAPALVGTLNLPGTVQTTSVRAVGSLAFVGRRSGSSAEFSVISAASPSNPVVIGDLNLNGSVTALDVQDGYAYVGTDKKNSTLEVINVTVPTAPSLVTTAGVSGGTALTAIQVAGETAVVGAGSTVHVVSIANPASPQRLGSYAALGTVNDLSLRSDSSLAFVATTNILRELEVINYANPASIGLVGDYSDSAFYHGIFYDLVHDRVFCATDADVGELRIIAP